MENTRAYVKVGENRYRESPGLYFEEFTVGTVIEHRPGRTLTEADNVWQSLINMNHSPLHIDAAYCEKTEFRKPLISSLVTFSVINGMSVNSLTAKGIANLGWDKVRLLAPCFAGDTVYAESKVLSARLSQSRPHQGIVTCETRGVKADGTVILTCERTFIIPTRDHTSHRDARY
ncbi:MaoC family dehydratase [Pendulispora albinea]|uniref:MaoC family dehydratase n=1 Tax=Pendulispora albinea TaxID=2741071 RepID=A0ABZ2M1I4_9BACT